MPNILIAGELHPAGIDLLKKRSNYTFDYIKEVSDENFLPYLENADALLLRTQRFRKEDIEQTNNLKIVSRHGVGFDSIDMKALRKKNIPLYPVRNLGHILAYGKFELKNQNGFI